MKKTLVFVLVLGLLGAMAFAQSAPALQWTGYLNSGAVLSSTTVGSNTYTNMSFYGSDAGKPYRVNIMGKYAADNWGMYFRFRNQSVPDADYFPRIYGWVTAANGMVKLMAGRLGTYDYSTNGWQSFGNQDTAYGLQAELMPVKGLTIGVFAPLVDGSTTTNSLNWVMNSLQSGFMYSMDNVGYISAGLDAGNHFFWVGLSYTGMAALTAVIEAKDLMSATEANNYFYTDQHFAYNMAPLNIGLWAEEQFNAKPAAGAPSTMWRVMPSVDYTMDVYNFGAFVNVLGDGTNTGFGPGAWAKVNVAKGVSTTLSLQYDTTISTGESAPTINGSANLSGPWSIANFTKTDGYMLVDLDFIWSF